MQLANDIAAADELAVDVNLRNCRPVAVALDPFAQLRVAQHVGRRVRHAQLIEDRNRRGRKAALRKAAIALHENHDLVFFDRRVDLLDYVRHLISSTSGSGTGPESTSSRSAHALARASRRPAPG